MNVETGKNWEDFVQRHDVFAAWQDAFANDLSHSELGEKIEFQIRARTALELKVDLKRLRTWCEQIRRSLISRLDKEKEANPNPTEEQRNAWQEFEDALPRLCHGAKSGERTDYDAIWASFKNDVKSRKS